MANLRADFLAYLTAQGFAPAASPETCPVLAGAAGEAETFLPALASAIRHADAVLLVDPAMPPPRLRPSVTEIALMQETAQADFLFLLPTSGSTGGAKWIAHSFATLTAAADAFAQQINETDARHVSPLPLSHVGGLMPLFRAWRGEGRFDAVRAEALTEEAVARSTLSLVPTQVARLLEEPSGVAAMRACRRILLGGSALPHSLADQARAAGIPLAPCYGMTETAALITLLEPEAFLAGFEGVGRPLPGVKLKCARDGRLGVRGPTVGWGAWRDDGTGWEPFAREPFWTDDLAEDSAEGHWRILGRRDHLINTGGRKVDPSAVVRVLRAAESVLDAAVVGVAHLEWGETVAAVVETVDGALPAGLEAAARQRLPGYAVPKAWRAVTALPRNGLGKVSAPRLRALFTEDAASLPADR